MTQFKYHEIKKEHAPDCTCSFCGQKYNVIPFKSGYVCEQCVDYIKTSYDEKDSDDSGNSNK